MNRLEDLREWLMDRIDGSEETRGDDSLISHFIRQIDALPSETGPIPASKTQAKRFAAQMEPRGCPTPGACSAAEYLAELNDLKQRILPQFAGRAERAENAKRMVEHERDGMLEELIVRRTAIANLHSEINEMRNAARSATGEPSDIVNRILDNVQKCRLVDENFTRTLDQISADVGLLAAQSLPVEAKPSATAAPVAWMYEENGERMFGHPDGYRPKDAVPLYAGRHPDAGGE